MCLNKWCLCSRGGAGGWVEDAGSQIALHHREYYQYYYCIFQSLFKATMRQEDRKHFTLRRSKFARLFNIWHAVASVAMLTCTCLFPRYLLKKHRAPFLATSTANEKACLHFPADIVRSQNTATWSTISPPFLPTPPSFAKPQTFTAFA